MVGAGVPSIFRTSSRNSVGTSRTRQRPRLVENVSGEFHSAFVRWDKNLKIFKGISNHHDAIQLQYDFSVSSVIGVY